MIDFSKPADEGDVYPAVHNFRVITDAAVVDAERAIAEAISVYEIASPLSRGRSSSGGKYLVFHFAARLSSRAEHHALDAAVKALPGVRILL